MTQLPPDDKQWSEDEAEIPAGVTDTIMVNCSRFCD